MHDVFDDMQETGVGLFRGARHNNPSMHPRHRHHQPRSLVQTIGQYDQYEDEFFQSLIETAQEMVDRNQTYLASLIEERNKRIQAQVANRRRQQKRSSKERQEGGRGKAWKYTLIFLVTTIMYLTAMNSQPQLFKATMDLMHSSFHEATRTATAAPPPHHKATSAASSSSSSFADVNTKEAEEQYRKLLERTLAGR